MGSVVENRLCKPSFFQPIDRPSKNIFTLCDQFFSFGHTKWVVNHQRTQGKKRIYKIADRDVIIQRPYLPVLIKITIIAASFWGSKRLTTALLLGAFTFKCLLRRSEEFCNPEPPAGEPTAQRAPISDTDLQEAALIRTGSNQEKWRNKWVSSAFFPLLAMGLQMKSMEEYFRRDSEKGPDQLVVAIGIEGCTLPKAFVEQSPFLVTILTIPMAEGQAAQQEPGTPVLTLNEDDLPFSVAALQSLSEKWMNLTQCEWDQSELQILDFLGFNPDLKPTNPNMLRIKGLLSLEEGSFPLEWSEAPPQTKCTSPGYAFFPDITGERPFKDFDNLGGLQSQFSAHCQKILEHPDLPFFKKHYYINKLVSDFIAKLNNVHTAQIIPNLITAIDGYSDIAPFINILDLPQPTNYARLGELLERLPNLFWLKAGYWDDNHLDISTFPECPSIKVVSFEEKFSDRDVARLMKKMPHLIMTDIP